MVKISVVIPCYNQGRYLDSSVGSVLAQGGGDYEIIVVNDGSTEDDTLRILDGFERDRTRVIHTSNQGLASARNNGISVALGKYILPLDADDRIEPGYLEKAAAVLDQHAEVGIVYCRAQLFGGVDTEWLLPSYSLEEMLKDNVIFCSAMFRRDDWQLVGGYDPGMVYGWEDYDFWLSLIERGREVYRIDEILFSYRVASDSMVRSKERSQKVAMFKRIFERHQKLFADNIEVWLEQLIESREKYYTSRLYVDCGEGISDETSVYRKIEKTTHTITFDLSEYHNIQAMRFDPIDVPAAVVIHRCVAGLVDGSSTYMSMTGNNACQVIGNIHFFDSDDPQFFFDCSPEILAGICSMTVQLSFRSVGEDTLQQIVRNLKGQLQPTEMKKPLSVITDTIKRRFQR